MVRTEIFTAPGKAYNEDTVFVCDDFGFVIDGATGYGSTKITDEDSDAKWFSNTWKDYLIENLGNLDLSINQIMKQGIFEVLKKLMKYDKYLDANIKPSAAIVLFRKNKDKIECFCLADCSLFIVKKDGTFEHFITHDITEIDNRNKEFTLKFANERNLTYREAKRYPEIVERTVQMFLNRNTPTGGWVLSDSLEAIDNGKYKEFDLDEIESIYGFSDGYSQIFDLFEFYTPEQLIEQFKSGKSLKEINEILYNLQEDDIDCIVVNRSKVRDDSTALKYEIV